MLLWLFHSPSGKLVQIEYALAAVAAGGPSVGIKGELDTNAWNQCVSLHMGNTKYEKQVKELLQRGTYLCSYRYVSHSVLDVFSHWEVKNFKIQTFWV